ncbi:MAG TPA: hypothetical protein VGV38_15500 [Pyrinomonadaceae bacterium]|nr:hypothetical protein [Pyrinomonadaceae bacterium]
MVEINLAADDLMRSGDDTSDRPRAIVLSPERQRLRLRMPRGSVGGRYTIRLVDAFGKLLASGTAHSDGKTLTVELDLRGLPAKSYRLCLARGVEAPDCYLVSLARPEGRAVK